MDGSLETLEQHTADVVVVGAGIAGLAATLSLATIGLRVTLLESHAHLGGKIRNVPTQAGPAAAGPTVLTLRHVFDDLFQMAGVSLEDVVPMIKQDTIARHFWPDGSSLDLFADHAISRQAIKAFSGEKSADEFDRFCERAERLFDAFEGPVMSAAEPNMTHLVGHVLRQPSLIPTMGPFFSLRGMLMKSFTDPRLRQLFGRYATYVGAAPAHAPAILSLIWQAEARGVWAIPGGISRLAEGIAATARARGARILTGMHVAEIIRDGSHVTGVRCKDGRVFNSAAVIHAGDPRALASGLCGRDVSSVAAQTLNVSRSFSARVHSFAARPEGPELAHHNVFFDANPDEEFADLMAGKLPRNPSFYICAMDRDLGQPVPDPERFEIITNAPAMPDSLEDPTTWNPKIIQKMARFGIRFSPMPSPASVTTETHFSEMFPGSKGALYGQSSHQLTASLKRPTARSGIPGLYLAGGGCHPGAGVPMAALSAKHAVAAIVNDRILASRSRPMAMHGGTSMV